MIGFRLGLRHFLKVLKFSLTKSMGINRSWALRVGWTYPLACLLFVSCETTPPVDDSLSPLKANLYTQELSGCGKRGYGTLACSNFNSDISFLMFYKGDFVIRSTCGFNRSFRFEKLGWMTFEWQELFEHKSSDTRLCLFETVQSIDGFDSPLLGRFIAVDEPYPDAIARIHGSLFIGAVSFQRIRGYGGSDVLEFPYVFKSGKLRVTGCGFEDVVSYDSKEGVVSYRLRDLSRPCVYQFRFRGERVNRYFVLDLSEYSSDYNSLSDPMISFSDGEYLVEWDGPVAVTGHDSEFYWTDSDIEFEAVDGMTHFIRALTGIGRYNLLGIRGGRVVWRPLIF